MAGPTETQQGRVLAGERRQRIKEMANETDFLRVADLTKVLGVSAVAIRRDLRYLAEQGELRKVRGGAASEKRAPVQTAFDEKMLRCRAEKERIGEAAASLIEARQTIYLGTGTTCAQIARRIGKGLQVTVVPQSTAVATELGTRQDVDVILLGGIYDGNRRATHGPLTWDGLRRFYFDQAFSGVDGIRDDGRVTVSDLTDLETIRIVHANCRIATVTADHSKIGHMGFIQIAPDLPLHRLITDCAADAQVLSGIEAHGITVIVV
ncbi:MAG: DeoR/GlpR family DNA-binding transcription regulator [Nitrososphaerales archaeon]